MIGSVRLVGSVRNIGRVRSIRFLSPRLREPARVNGGVGVQVDRGHFFGQRRIRVPACEDISVLSRDISGEVDPRSPELSQCFDLTSAVCLEREAMEDQHYEPAVALGSDLNRVVSRGLTVGGRDRDKHGHIRVSGRDLEHTVLSCGAVDLHGRAGALRNHCQQISAFRNLAQYRPVVLIEVVERERHTVYRDALRVRVTRVGRALGKSDYDAASGTVEGNGNHARFLAVKLNVPEVFRLDKPAVSAEERRYEPSAGL